MKYPLLLSAVALSLVALTATTLYAQATGTSIVDKMKAAAHSFTLATTLNPSDSGLTSDPVKGKKTGDILTAGEYNRLLELVSEGGGGSGSAAFYFCTNAQSLDTSNAPCNGASLNNGSGNGRYRAISASFSGAGAISTNPELQFFSSKWKCSQAGVGHFDCTDGSVLVADTQATGGGSGGTGWVNVPLTDTADFDQNCQHRFRISSPGNTNDDGFIGDDNAYNYVMRSNPKRLAFIITPGFYEHINSDSKTIYRTNGQPSSPLQTITQIQKRCN